MERTKELWAQQNYPPTENEIKYNEMMVNHDLFDVIVNDVCNITRTTHDELYNKTKDNHITSTRYLIYYLAKECGHRLNSIVRYMKANGFETTTSTVIYGIKQINEKLETDANLKTYVSAFLEESI